MISHGLFLLNTREGLVEGYAGDLAFVNALETFGGEQNDPICVAFGGTHSGFLTLFE